MDADLAQLLRGSLGDINAVLLACHDADDKADFRAVSLVVAGFSHRAADGFQNGFCLFGVVVVVLDGVVVIDVALQRTVGRHALTQKHSVNDCLPVDRVADGGDDVFIFGPVVVPEVEQNPAVVAGFHIVAGKTVFANEILCIFGIEQRQVQLAGFQLYCLRVVVGNDFEDDAVDVRRTLKIAFVLFQNDCLPHVPA